MDHPQTGGTLAFTLVVAYVTHPLILLALALALPLVVVGMVSLNPVHLVLVVVALLLGLVPFILEGLRP